MSETSSVSAPAVNDAPATANASGPVKELVALTGSDTGRRIAFRESLRIGRLEPGAAEAPGTLWIEDPSVSSRHCVLTQDRDGRCFVRDLSLNGTRIDHHRLVPGAETEIKPGQILSVGSGHDFRLEGSAIAPAEGTGAGTVLVAEPIEVTVLVGDICGYTKLVSEVAAELLQPSVNALFRGLDERVADLDGTVKEHPGDAVLAYWEASASESCADRACRAALVLDAEARRLGADPSVWRLRDRPLEMDWGLCTGKVTVRNPGGPHPVGLSVIGVPIVKAFLVEKLASPETGRILACAATRARAGGRCRFQDLGPRVVPGFRVAEEIFALVELA